MKALQAARDYSLFLSLLYFGNDCEAASKADIKLRRHFPDPLRSRRHLENTLETFLLEREEESVLLGGHAVWFHRYGLRPGDQFVEVTPPDPRQLEFRFESAKVVPFRPRRAP
ncbi:MAG: hypothetical protein HY474_02150 [Candidatus Sungbacteria bacterium]|uniref:Uncharacterized protein n=1 Tax=Candidatus Sungiibacteriota bacterium TaxID=2750080 RepID=A0A932YY54_9BACT|nr:hypothetical protein [Candidatus Sungbacteria bacterium]